MTEKKKVRVRMEKNGSFNYSLSSRFPLSPHENLVVCAQGVSRMERRGKGGRGKAALAVAVAVTAERSVDAARVETWG